MKQADLPPITISAMDYARLTWIATPGVNRQLDPVIEMLAGELGRAVIAAPGAIRPDVVTMHSEVEYQDDVTGEVHRITLVYPGQEKPDAGRVSILTPVGAALLGLSEGQTMEWQVPVGGRRGVTVRRVHFQPEQVADRSAA
jgi:regulator of nucleoside diphosphate kinase